MNAFTILFLGFLLGLRHATDADHVVAVTTIVSKQRKLSSAALVGITWGIGHSIMILLVGIAIIIFHVVIPIKIQQLFEFIVSLLLIALGILNLTGVMQKIATAFTPKQKLHTHFHLHDHLHLHVHNHPENVRESMGRKEEIGDFIRIHGLFQLVRPFVVGLVHGLAGSAAVALLILGSIKDTTTSLLYLAIFGIGTILGMMIITTALGIPIIATSKRLVSFDRNITWLSGLVSLIFGSYLAYQIGVVDGLFTH